ncbi:hypothetical protein NUW54_g14112 [Trametes sanguinea]|uniref:Uncharacterized protein n=1 Tax=Trametes sanguinea TaxID=158606 RepID=A0ACC1MF49_9APHY|nr:hypothetical protein NUW54_g14112 [Trametes sanguinea]
MDQEGHRRLSACNKPKHRNLRNFLSLRKLLQSLRPLLEAELISISGKLGLLFANKISANCRQCTACCILRQFLEDPGTDGRRRRNHARRASFAVHHHLALRCASSYHLPNAAGPASQAAQSRHYPPVPAKPACVSLRRSCCVRT